MIALRRTPTYEPVAPGELVLPGYRVVRQLTHGRRLDTYDALDEDRDCRVIVKILRPDRLHEEHVRESVRLEAEIVTTLSHPHLVRGYAAYDEPPAVVLETLSGATLSRLLDDGPLNPDDVAMLGAQLVSVLGFLHRHDWLHLDVKPANIVVRGGQAVLIDLSLASRPGEGRPGSGTDGYLAPEQATGRCLSGATDVWGLGITLLEALTGELVYGSDASWRTRRRPQRVRLAAATLAGLPPGWHDVLLSCVEPDQAARPSLRDVRAALDSG